MLWALSPICTVCSMVDQLFAVGDEEHSEKTTNNKISTENFILKRMGDQLIAHAA